MQLTELGLKDRAAWMQAGYDLPQYDRAAVREKTLAAPQWIHFGAGNIFRAFQANLAQRMLNDGLMEVTLIRMPDLFTEYPLIANALINDVDNKYIVKFKTTRIEFWSSEDIEIPWTTDGEYGGSHKHIVIEDLYRALPIVLGEQPADVIDEEDRREEENYRKPRDENGKVTGN